MTTLMAEFAMLLDELDVGTYDPVNPGGGTIYLVRLPESPDVCMSVTPYTGVEGDAGLGYDKPRVQIRCRGSKNDRENGYALGKAVYDALQGLGSRFLPAGTWMVQCLAIQTGGGPAYMGVDQNGRDEWVVNVEFEVATNAPRARAH